MTLKMIYGTIILIFAIIGMTMLLDIRPMRLARKKWFLYLFSMILIVAVSVLLMLEIGKPFVPLYPVLVHLPLFIVFCVLSERDSAKVLFVLLTMVFMSYPPALLDIAVVTLLHVGPVLKMILLVLFCALTLFCIHIWMQRDFSYVMEYLTAGETLRFTLVPIGYYVLVYALGRYDNEFTAEPIRIVLFISTLGVYALLLSFFRHTREMERIRTERDVLNLQMETAEKQLDSLQENSKCAAIYRHDMRHHFSLLNGLLSEGDIEGALNYLQQTQTDIDAITPVQYCDNHAVNLIISHFADQAQKRNLEIIVEAKLPPHLELSETELCTVLSNGLENALYAVSKVEDKNLRFVHLHMSLNRDNLLLSIQNAFLEDVQIKHGIPISQRPGHGYGCRSILTIAEKRNGIATFKAVDGIFTLRVVLPLSYTPYTRSLYIF